MRKTTLLLLLLALTLHILPLSAQTDGQNTSTPSVTFTTEGLWNNTSGVANWVSLLNVDYEFSLWSGGSMWLDLLAVANVRQSDGKSGVADNLHIFSAIEDSPSTLALMGLGLSQRLLDGEITLSAGIRNLNKDYFTTPWNSLFTSALNGLFPSISTNFVVADAPLSAMALHGEWHPTQRWSLKASIYDGVASDKWNELFRLNIGRDGIFTIAELGYTGPEGSYVGNYRLGGTFGYAPTAAAFELGSHHKSRRASLWALAEQPLYHTPKGREMTLLLHGAWAPKSLCSRYGAVGLLCRRMFLSEDYVGIQLSRSLYEGGDESHIELTYTAPIGYCKIQPAIHRVHSSHGRFTITMVKLILEI